MARIDVELRGRRPKVDFVKNGPCERQGSGGGDVPQYFGAFGRLCGVLRGLHWGVYLLVTRRVVCGVGMSCGGARRTLPRGSTCRRNGFGSRCGLVDGGFRIPCLRVEMEVVSVRDGLSDGCYVGESQWWRPRRGGRC